MEVVFELKNGKKIKLIFGILERLACDIIVGLPMLNDTRIVIPIEYSYLKSGVLKEK